MKRGGRAKKNQQKRYFHYTTPSGFMGIVETGGIMPSSAWAEILGEPSVWLSSNPDWEQSASYGLITPDGIETVPLTRDGLFQRGYPPIRIEIDQRCVKFMDWDQIRLLLTEEEEAEFEFFTATEGADLSEWHTCFGFIPLSVCIFPHEVWNGERWVPFIGAFPYPKEIESSTGCNGENEDEMAQMQYAENDEREMPNPHEMRNPFEHIMDAYRKAALENWKVSIWQEARQLDRQRLSSAALSAKVLCLQADQSLHLLYELNPQQKK